MKFRTIHTAYGLQRLAQAEATGIPIKLTAMAVGDGGGKEMYPSMEMTQLVREIAGTRGAPNAVYQDPDDPTRYTTELVIDAELGGFHSREIGIWDDAGGLFAVGNLPESYIPHKSEGATGNAIVRMDFMVTNADIVTIELAPVTLVTREWLSQNVTLAKLLPGGIKGQIPKKRSNVDGDIEWDDPDAFDIVVNTIEEQQTLAAGQVDVDLVETSTIGLAVYINGERLPNMAGADGWQAHPTNEFRVVLGKSYAAGTRLTAVQNEPSGQLTGALQEANNLADLEDKAKARENLGVYSMDEADQLAPVGMIAYFARASAPAGWLKANGAEVSRTAYAKLHQVIGNTYGAGDGLNTFALPDLRGEFIRGWDDGRGIDPARQLGSPQASQNLAHDHAGKTDVSGSHSHSYIDTDTVVSSGSLGSGSSWQINDRESQRTSGSAGSHSHNLTVNSSGGNEARPRNVALLACIKY
jgi:phage-related tail fiber protein